jgi:flavin-binding protein dodecin
MVVVAGVMAVRMLELVGARHNSADAAAAVGIVRSSLDSAEVVQGPACCIFAISVPDYRFVVVIEGG